MDEFVAYCRSSVGGRAIGLEIQHASIEAYASRLGAEIVGWYTDVGPASHNQRRLARAQPELVRAIEHARRVKARLIVARLDRLTRSTSVLAAILDSCPVPLVVETPSAGPFVLQIYAAVAEEYRRQASRRCKAGIAAAIASGVDRRKHARKAASGRRAKAKRYAEEIRPVIEDIRRGRRLSIGDVAAELNARGLRTLHNNPWRTHSVMAVWNRFHRKWDTHRFRGRQPTTCADETAAAYARAETFRTLIQAYRDNGAVTAQDFMDRLNKAGVRMAKGGAWTLVMTRTLLRRLRKGQPHGGKSRRLLSGVDRSPGGARVQPGSSADARTPLRG